MSVCAMVFPGQGSQEVGMLSELAISYPIVEETFSEASDALSYDLWKLVQQGPAEELNKTWKTQPALLAASVSIWRVWKQQGGQIPKIMAGHSLGEYSALVCSDGLNFASAIKLVALRGTLMQEAVPTDGAMYAIVGLDDDMISSICAKAEQEGNIVFPVNFNAPGQVVIAGHKEAVERTSIICKSSGARVFPLPISVPSHCALMKPVADKLALAMESVNFFVPRVPVVNNVDVRTEQNPEAIRKALVRQLYSPVRWTETVNYLVVTYGVNFFLEAGPGNVLTALNKRIVINLSSTAVNNPMSLAAALKY